MWRQQDKLETAGNKILQQDCHASPWFCHRGDVKVHLHHQDLSAWLQGLRHRDLFWFWISNHLASKSPVTETPSWKSLNIRNDPMSHALPEYGLLSKSSWCPGSKDCLVYPKIKKYQWSIVIPSAKKPKHSQAHHVSSSLLQLFQAQLLHAIRNLYLGTTMLVKVGGTLYF